ncbi:hypothetical protein [Lysobacter sp. Root690]|uniref:hypothetical protein n=1 Tax=Lysobacter sp. Root690 TaxID=1736588 RepID=UPI0006FA5A12|nr:hypothetical protein [Lysobacter sp. Root690]KRB06713.1 hypothetical protein ASD86_11895 [Lysobacter sp. Root690]
MVTDSDAIRRKPPVDTAGRLFGVLAWFALLLGPLLAWAIVFGLTPQNQCGDWSLHCSGKAIMYSAASWLFGSLLAITALFRGEQRGIAVPALVLNMIPLMGLVAAYVLIAKGI